MKESSVSILKSPKFSKATQCDGKFKYDLKRRAMDDAHGLAKDHPESVFTVYLCPHCNYYHVGRVPR